MKKILLCLVAAASLAAAAPKKPKLVLAVVIDQFRYDYLTRFRAEYTGGLDRLLRNGAVFSNARFIHFPNVTAAGHATFLSGATPSVSGIVANDWFDHEEDKHVTSVSDDKTQIVGGKGGRGSSPRRLLVSTVGDELKMAHGAKSRVIGVSLKDRAAVLPAGHAADGAYWFDTASGTFVSSTYYFADVPDWVKDFNRPPPAEKYRGVTWLNHKLPEDLKELYGTSLKSPFESSPFGNELVEQFAERALAEEKLGTHDATDLLAVSYSSNDKVGHDYGMFSPEEHEVTVLTDKLLARLFEAVDRQVGLDDVLVVLVADHGVSPSAEELAARRMPGGRMPGKTVRNAVQAALVKKYGEGNWVLGDWDLLVYLNRALMAEHHLDPAQVDRAAGEAIMALPHILRVYTREQLMAGAVPGDELSRRVMSGFNVRRSPDVAFIPEPYWVETDSVATHGSPFSYDAHVPVIFMGPGIRAGRYDGNIEVNDVAPTLATILEVETPSGSIGRVLTEMFAP